MAESEHRNIRSLLRGRRTQRIRASPATGTFREGLEDVSEVSDYEYSTHRSSSVPPRRSRSPQFSSGRSSRPPRSHSMKPRGEGDDDSDSEHDGPRRGTTVSSQPFAGPNSTPQHQSKMGPRMIPSNDFRGGNRYDLSGPFGLAPAAGRSNAWGLPRPDFSAFMDPSKARQWPHNLRLGFAPRITASSAGVDRWQGSRHGGPSGPSSSMGMVPEAGYGSGSLITGTGPWRGSPRGGSLTDGSNFLHGLPMNPYGAFQHHLAKQITIRGAPQVPDMNQPRDGGGGRQKDIVRSEKGRSSEHEYSERRGSR